MAIETEVVAVYNGTPPTGTRTPKELVEALADVAKARSMRDLLRYNKQREVSCALRVPLLKGSYPVESGELGRALRKVIRGAVDAASSGDHVLVDFIPESDARLIVKAGPAAQMGGLDSSAIKQLYGG